MAPMAMTRRMSLLRWSVAPIAILAITSAVGCASPETPPAEPVDAVETPSAI